MTKEQLTKFLSKQKTAFLSSIDDNGFPCTRAMMAPRKIEKNAFWFSTNTSSKKVAQYANNPNACLYFYRRGRFKFQGAMLKGAVEICTDPQTKRDIWRFGDTLFYKGGVTDPDYCVLKFTASEAEYYCDFKIETIPLE